MTGNEFARQQQVDQTGIDTLDLADEAQVRGVTLDRLASCVDETTVLTVEPDRAAAVPVDEARQFLVEFAECHFDDRERAFIRHPHAAMAPVLDAHLLRQFIDAPTPAVHHDGLHADRSQQCDVARESGLEHGVGHRLPAEAHDERPAVIRADVRQRLGEYPPFVDAGHGGQTCMLSVFDVVCPGSTSTRTSTS